MREAKGVLGLAYGDEAKGRWIDSIVRYGKIRFVVRYNGGSQAHHRSKSPDGRSHCFRQFCSASLVPGTCTGLSRFMLVEIEELLEEVKALGALGVSNPLRHIFISENAPVITPFNRLLNQMQEISRGGSRHGSCGFGIGLTQGDVEDLEEKALYIKDFRNADHLMEKLSYLHGIKLKQAEKIANEDNAHYFENLKNCDLRFYAGQFLTFNRVAQVISDENFAEIISKNDVAFEGAQGTLLDQNAGFFPHCTRSNCTFENVEILLKEANFKGEFERIGLFRGYGTRHGAGPFVTEDNSVPIELCHNGHNLWQESFRQGWFDAVAARYALEMVGGVDTIGISNLDRMQDLPEVKVCTAYEGFSPEFFTSDRILPLKKGDLESSARRTASMDSIKPVYETYSGKVKGKLDYKGYLSFLSELVGQEIRNYSDSDCGETVVF